MNRRQKILKRRMQHDLFWSVILIILIFVLFIVILADTWQEDMQAIQTMGEATSEEYPERGVETKFSLQTSNEVVVDEQKSESTYPVFTYSKDWDSDDDYLLAKIAMAEAEGCSTETKVRIIQTILNRVHDDYFPDTIHDVLYQKAGKVWQFSPIGDGRWNRVEPNEDCWLALQIVKEAQYDESLGALYFESCVDPNNWHSRNLEFLYELDGMRFYK